MGESAGERTPTPPETWFDRQPARGGTCHAAHDLTMETLYPADDPRFTAGTPLLALDVDGPLNTLDDEEITRRRRAGNYKLPDPNPGSTRFLVRTGHGTKLHVDLNLEVISALDDLARSGELVIGWLTTWGPNVRAIIEQALDGKLAGGFVLTKMPPKHRGYRPAEWKRKGLRERLAAHPSKWVWADDEEIAIGRLDPNFQTDPLFETPGMLIEPPSTVGLTMDDIDRIAAFVRA